MSEGLTLSQLAEKNALLATDNAALQQKLDAVLAENVALKKAIDTHKHGFVRCECCGEENMCHNDDVCRVLDETPATDAILNEVRAEGVEIYAQSLRRKQEDAFTESEYRHTKLGRAAVSAEKFASQLRAGSTEGGM